MPVSQRLIEPDPQHVQLGRIRQFFAAAFCIEIRKYKIAECAAGIKRFFNIVSVFIHDLPGMLSLIRLY